MRDPFFPGSSLNESIVGAQVDKAPNLREQQPDDEQDSGDFDTAFEESKQKCLYFQLRMKEEVASAA